MDPVRDPSLTTSGESVVKPADSSDGLSLLAKMEKDYQKQEEKKRTTRKPFVFYPVPGRDGWQFKYKTDLPWPRLKLMTAEAQDENPNGGTVTDFYMLGLALMKELCAGFLYHDEEVVTNGEPMKFGSAAMKNLLSTESADESIRTLYSNTETGNPDPYIVAMARSLMGDCGYNEGVSPTPR